MRWGGGGCEARSLQFSVMRRRPLAYAWPWLAWSGVGLALAPLDAGVCGPPSQSCKTCCPASSTSWAPTTLPTSRSSPRPTREEARTARCKRLATVWALASAPNPSPRTSALRPSRGPRARQRAHHTPGAAPPDPCSARSKCERNYFPQATRRPARTRMTTTMRTCPTWSTTSRRLPSRHFVWCARPDAASCAYVY